MYRVTRDPNGASTYTVDVNLNYRPTIERAIEVYGDSPLAPSDLQGFGSPNSARRQMIEDALFVRTRQCFASMQGRLRSSDGTLINLNLVQSSTHPEVPKVPIRIQTSDFRSISTDWSGAIDCSSITHEVMHLLGLCDGYQETMMGVSERQRIPFAGEDNFDHRYSRNRYDCRSIEPESSMMRNLESLESRVEVMSCPPSGTRSVQVATMPLACPDGKGGASSTITRRVFQSWLNQRGDHFTFYYRDLPRVAFPLFPAQTRFIVNPGCEEQSLRYTTCAQNAYRTHSMRGCLDVPDYCSNGEYLQ